MQLTCRYNQYTLDQLNSSRVPCVRISGEPSFRNRGNAGHVRLRLELQCIPPGHWRSSVCFSYTDKSQTRSAQLLSLSSTFSISCSVWFTHCIFTLGKTGFCFPLPINRGGCLSRDPHQCSPLSPARDELRNLPTVVPIRFPELFKHFAFFTPGQEYIRANNHRKKHY